MDVVKKEPKPLTEFRPRSYAKEFERKDAEDAFLSEEESEEEEPAEPVDEWDTVPVPKRGKRTKYEKKQENVE